MEEEQKPIKLNIYKLNQKIKSFDDFLFSTKAPPYEVEAEHLSGGFQYRLFVQRDKISKPQWTNLFGSLLQKDVANRSSSFVLFIKKVKGNKDYFFAMTGGHTAYGLVQKYIEEEFGLNIAEKSIDPKKIKNINQTTFTGSDKQIIRAVKAYNPAYDIENQRRILKSLEGKTVNPDLIGFSLSGADSLAVKKPITIDELSDYFDTLLNLYTSTDTTIKLQKTFHVIKNKELILKLQNKLVENFTSLVNSNGEENIESFFIGYKDYFDFLRCNRFVISKGERKKHDNIEDLEIETIIKFIKEFNLPIDYELFKSIDVLGLGENEEEIIPEVSLLSFLYSEVALDQKTYFFIDNKWYELDESYKKFIDNAVGEFDIKNDELPPYKKSVHTDENSYNKSVPSQKASIVCLDRTLTKYKVEACDLYCDKLMTFYHVKRAWGAKLSHLFAQGLVASQLFSMDPDFRAECHTLENRIDPKFQQLKFRVVFAIIHDKANNSDFPKNMTYFSKVNFLDTASRIRSFGFRVEIVPVKIES
jgi:uncharacterized protein (TIGR04141 family)